MLTYFIVFCVLGFGIGRLIGVRPLAFGYIAAIALIWGRMSEVVWGLAALGELFVGFYVATALTKGRADDGHAAGPRAGQANANASSQSGPPSPAPPEVRKTHTHYDNLNVMRDAPPEVIRAAFKTLSQKYHPDRNNGDSESARIMTILNVAYQVLSDPVQRKAYDKELRDTESRATSKGDSYKANSKDDAFSEGKTTSNKAHSNNQSQWSSRGQNWNSEDRSTNRTRTESYASHYRYDSGDNIINVALLAIVVVFTSVLIFGANYQDEDKTVIAQVSDIEREAVIESFADSSASVALESHESASAPHEDPVEYYDKGRSLLENSQGMVDYILAQDYFERAYALGYPKAGYELGYLHEMEMIRSADPVKAIMYYEAAAAVGHPNAAYRLGVLYSIQHGFHFDPKKAEYLLSRAKALGHGDAERKLLELRAMIGVN